MQELQCGKVEAVLPRCIHICLCVFVYVSVYIDIIRLLVGIMLAHAVDSYLIMHAFPFSPAEFLRHYHGNFPFLGIVTEL